MAEVTFYKATSVPGTGIPDSHVFVKEPLATRVKYYLADTGGTLFPVGLQSEADVLNTILNGYSVGANTPIAPSNSVLQAFAQLQGQINSLSSAVAEGIKTPVPIDCSTNPDYPASEAGDSYRVSVAGRIGGASGSLVKPNDMIIALVDTAGGDEDTVGYDFTIIQANVDNATEGVTGLSRIATEAEVLAGTESFAYVTPLRLSAALALKQNVITGAASTVTGVDLNASRAVISNSSGKIADSVTTATEIGYSSGLTGNIQAQINSISSSLSGYVTLNTAQTITGQKTFSTPLFINGGDRALGAELRLTNGFNGSGWVVGDVVGTINFHTVDVSATELTRGRIQSIVTGAGAGTFPASTSMTFSTTNINTLNEVFRATANQNVLIGTTTDSGAKLDVNGTLRVQSVANATGNFATYSATGVLQQRTPAQVLIDIGAQAAGSYVPTTRTLTIANGTGITGGGAAVDLSANRSWTIGLTGQALALHNLATNGLIVRTGSGTVSARTLTGSDSVEVTNGDGVSGNPTFKTKYAATPEW